MIWMKARWIAAESLATRRPLLTVARVVTGAMDSPSSASSFRTLQAVRALLCRHPGASDEGSGARNEQAMRLVGRFLQRPPDQDGRQVASVLDAGVQIGRRVEALGRSRGGV